jgi:SpoVK/Ycf46/Vps4 family AAA+-type ATPase
MAPDVDLDKLASACVGKTGADVAWVCRRATYLAIREALEGSGGAPTVPPEGVEVSAAHFAEVLAAPQG